MSYQCGTGPLLESALGIKAGPPRIICDGCGLVFEVKGGRRSGPPAWFIANKAPPKWKGTRTDEVRWDYCPACPCPHEFPPIPPPRSGLDRMMVFTHGHCLRCGKMLELPKP